MSEPEPRPVKLMDPLSRSYWLFWLFSRALVVAAVVILVVR